MSDEGDRACPLCAEEMDLTDQQLKPCKCGYEICVWCWHHIMDMAEKDRTQGRCPACRSPYNKDKIVGTTSKCERLVAVMNMERKTKSQKAKSKISDGRKQLGNVRVIQKNLVYIVGLPLTLADEKLLQQRDYFGQYGRVLKVSISRTAAGSIQQFANDTCSVYITYSKEEEAYRCIQSVHGFVLNDRPLKACFGTTKYCHAWLRNMPCSNPDCLYLHEIGSQEDSFSKDDVAAAHTRNRVQQITGATSNMQPRAGNVLPPPEDECLISNSTIMGKPMSKSASNNLATGGNSSPPNSSRGNSSPPNSSRGRFTALPSAASWGSRASNGNPPKQKPETDSASAAFTTAVATTVEAPHLHAEMRKKLIDNEGSQNKSHKGGKVSPKSSKCTVKATAHEAPTVGPPSPKKKGNLDKSRKGVQVSPKNSLNVSAQGNNNFSAIELKNIPRLLGLDPFEDNRPHSSSSSNRANSSSTSSPSVKTIAFADDSRVPKEECGVRPEFDTGRLSVLDPDLKTIGTKSDSKVATPRVREGLQSLEGKKLNDSEFFSSTSYFSASSPALHRSNFSTQTEPYGSSRLIPDPPILDSNINKSLLLHKSGSSELLNGCPGNVVDNYVNSDRKFEHANLKNKLVDWSEGEAAHAEQSVATDMGERNIISNILSLDFDPWEESLNSPNLVKLLAEADKRQGPRAPSTSWKMQNSNKSRFSFARADEDRESPSSVESSFGHMQPAFKENPSKHDFLGNRDFNFDKFGDTSGFSTSNTEELDNLAGSYSYLSSNNISGSRSQVSAPPGFLAPNKAPPPGFALHKRVESNYDSISGNHFHDTSSLLRNSYQSQQIGNIGSSTDIEFMDPAILAVGVGRIPNGINTAENEARLQSLMQRSSQHVQNQRYAGISNGFGQTNDTHNYLASRIMEQTLASNLSPFSQLGLQQPRTSMVPNGQWNGWSDESLGFNNFYGGYEDSKFRMSSSGDIYNRTYGI